MPGVDIETVTLDEKIDHPLDAVLARVDRSKTGPVMIVGLERAVPSNATEHPVLAALNLSRPDWVNELPRPLVFWVPDYLLGMMGREAPDFLDWRSDTLFFPDSLGEDLLSLDSNVWLSEASLSMSEVRRRARIEELSSRIALGGDSQDPVILAARAEWLAELGQHFMLLNEWPAARESLLRSLEIERKLERREEIAYIMGDIATLDLELGEMKKAEDGFKEAISASRKIGSRRSEVISLAHLALLKFRTGHFEEAEQFCRKALNIAESLGINDIESSLYNLMLTIRLGQGDIPAARSVAEKVLSMLPQGDTSLIRSDLLRNLGTLSSLAGDLARAKKYYEEAVAITRLMGDRQGLAHSLVNLGILHLRSERMKDAEGPLRQARDLYDQLKDTAGIERADKLLRQLSPSAPSFHQ